MKDIQKIYNLLEHEKLSPVFAGNDNDLFKRVIVFEIDALKYYIEWWANISYLSMGSVYGNYIPFTNVEINTTWPAYKRGLEFSDDKQVVAYVAIEKLDWQMEGIWK